MSLARAGPTSRANRCVPPAPGMTPSVISGWPSSPLRVSNSIAVPPYRQRYPLRSAAMTTYYRDNSVLVNSNAIIVDGRAYALADLDDVWLEEGAWQADRALAVLIMRSLVAAAGVALLAASVAVVSAPHHPGHGRGPDWVGWAYLMARRAGLGGLSAA